RARVPNCFAPFRGTEQSEGLPALPLRPKPAHSAGAANKVLLWRFCNSPSKPSGGLFKHLPGGKTTEVAWLDTGKFGQRVVVLDRYALLLDNHKIVLAKLPQNAVDVRDAKAQGVADK